MMELTAHHSLVYGSSLFLLSLWTLSILIYIHGSPLIIAIREKEKDLKYIVQESGVLSAPAPVAVSLYQVCNVSDLIYATPVAMHVASDSSCMSLLRNLDH
jgi:hypothetical protein